MCASFKQNICHGFYDVKEMKVSARWTMSYSMKATNANKRAQSKQEEQNTHIYIYIYYIDTHYIVVIF